MDILPTKEHPSIAAVEESSTVDTTSVDETSEMVSKASTQDEDADSKETAQDMLRSILSNRYFDDIHSSEDRFKLESIVTRLDTASEAL